MHVRSLSAELVAGLLAIGVVGAVGAQGLGAPIHEPSARAQARGISHYSYHRNGPVVNVDVHDNEGANMATLTLEWPDGQGVLIDCTTPGNRNFFINWKEDSGYVKIEDKDKGESIEIQLLNGEWTISGGKGNAQGHPFFHTNEDVIGFIVDAYEDALTNTGLRQWRYEQLARGMVETNDGKAGNLTFEKPSGKPSDGNSKILCGLFACDGPTFIETEDGLTRSSCCADAIFWVGIDCGATSPCETCCNFSCTSTCAVGDYICSCTAVGKSCKTPIACEEEFPPPCT